MPLQIYFDKFGEKKAFDLLFHSVKDLEKKIKNENHMYSCYLVLELNQKLKEHGVWFESQYHKVAKNKAKVSVLWASVKSLA